MGNPFARLAAGGKGSMVTLVAILLAVTAVAAIITSRLIDSMFPSSAGVAYAASSRSPAGGQLAPGYADVLIVELDEAWKRADWATAIETLSEILAIDSSNTSLRGRLYQAHVNLGWRLLVDHRFEEARGQFSQALEVDAQGSEAQEGLRLLQELVVPAGGPPPTAQPPVVLTPIPQPTAVPPAPAAPPVVATPVPQAAAVCPSQPVVAPTCAPVQVAPVECICIVVRKGDTLFGLARRFGTTVEAIIAVNQLQTTTILIGQKLLIPACPTQVVCAPVSVPVSAPVCAPVSAPVSVPVSAPVCPTKVVSAPVSVPVSAPVCPSAGVPVVTSPVVPVHVVQRGEDLFHIALRYQVSASLLMHVNGLTGTTLKAGQTLIIP